jgi:hypothetical protein
MMTSSRQSRLARRAEILALFERHSVAAGAAELATRFPGFTPSPAFIADLQAIKLTRALQRFGATEIEVLDARLEGR